MWGFVGHSYKSRNILTSPQGESKYKKWVEYSAILTTKLFLSGGKKITPDWLFTVEITIQYSVGFLYSICVTICTPLGAVGW